MSMTDPIADFLTRIRNGQSSGKTEINAPTSKVKLAIAKVLKDEGYIENFSATDVEGKPTLAVQLKYFQGRPVIDRLERISRPGLRVYKGKDELPAVLGGLGIAIVSTSQGVMTDRQARASGHGGEVICVVS
ncbi:30S ribosomal protein S8 [Steroidobacter sp.]|uniref:30S ribosomal protein S8 n=1 Tax=Steroidobacter sp. TaxID=1978227 RepID=UPI001A432FE5|nr:30S ribosomal protein S8 [Steroidobacter sp.]MBL8269879.1 30S ribosomal protein S8 [Steroidobacter sp.]